MKLATLSAIVCLGLTCSGSLYAADIPEYDKVEVTMGYDADGKAVLQKTTTTYINVGGIEMVTGVKHDDITSIELSHVADGKIAEGSTSAINGGQIYQMQQDFLTSPEITNGLNKINALDGKVDALDKRVDRLDGRIDELDSRFKKGMASNAALAGLFQPYKVGAANVSVGMGGYRDQTAIAIGAGYRVNENFAFKAGVANGGKKSTTYNASVNFEW